MNDWNSFTGGQEANERTQRSIDAWKARRARRNALALLAFVGAMVCFAFAAYVNPY